MQTEGANDGWEGLRERADAAAPVLAVTTTELNRMLTHYRAEGLADNTVVNPKVHTYSPPHLRVVDEGFNVIVDRPWSRTVWDVLDMVIVAKAHGGAVFLAQNVVTLGGDEWADGGFEVEVWPRVRLRPVNN
jgi:hypothetical protein